VVVVPLLALSLDIVAGASSFFHVKGLQYAKSSSKRSLSDVCGVGNTCAEACGPGYEQCGTSSLNCYNPVAGETCCPADGGYCPAGEYCSPVAGYCCDSTQDVTACAASQGFTLPASTATSPMPMPTASSGTTTTSPPVPAKSTSLASPTTYTGSAVKLDAGLASKAWLLWLALFLR